MTGRWGRGSTLAAVAVLGVAVRWRFLDFQSGDYRTFLSRWYAFISTNGHFAALHDDSFSNYNTPYLVLLALTSYLPIPPIVAIKTLSILGDLALAGVAAAIVLRLRPGARWAPVAAFGVVLLLPTVVMNSGVWGQCDSLYAAASLACVLCLLEGRSGAASAWFGLAFGFKLQAVFLLPALVAVVIINRHRWVSLLAAPAAFVATLVPALLAGRSLVSQLMVYPLQITDPSGTGGTVGGPGAGRRPPGGGGSGFVLNDGQSFTHNAPTPYAWLPADASVLWKYAGLALTVGVVTGLGVWLLARGQALSPTQIVLLAATSTLIIPLLLPEMHERYFYLAEVLLVVAGFADGWFWWPAAGMQAASITTYLSYLLNHTTVPLGWAAVVATASGLIAAVLLLRTLRAHPPGSPLFVG
ncbi:MAG TPA: glycosyltransferase 87 family protein [Micropruina sp.]|nr:glycosyltransferase 87 family protein [Micropruina sp.]